MQQAEQQDMYWPGGSPAARQKEQQEQRERLDALVDHTQIPKSIHARRQHFRENATLRQILDQLDRMADHYGRHDHLKCKPITITASQRDMLTLHYDAYLSLRDGAAQIAEQFRREVNGGAIPFWYRGFPLRVPT